MRYKQTKNKCRAIKTDQISGERWKMAVGSWLIEKLSVDSGYCQQWLLLEFGG